MEHYAMDNHDLQATIESTHNMIKDITDEKLKNKLTSHLSALLKVQKLRAETILMDDTEIEIDNVYHGQSGNWPEISNP